MAIKTLKITNELSEVEKIRSFLKNSLSELDVPEKDFFEIELSLLEICINIIRYAYPQGKGKISLKIWVQEEKVFVEVRDSGIHFDPSKGGKPDFESILRNGNKGGLGIFLSRKLMNGFDYKRENDQNILTMYKMIKKNKTPGSV